MYVCMYVCMYTSYMINRSCILILKSPYISATQALSDRGSISERAVALFLARSSPRVLAPNRPIWEFPKIGVPCFGVLIIKILLFRVLY